MTDPVVPWPTPILTFVVWAAWSCVWCWIEPRIGFRAFDDRWSTIPMFSAAMVILFSCGRRRTKNVVRHAAVAVPTGLVLVFVAPAAEMLLVPVANHDHVAPIRDAMFVLTEIIAIYTFAGITHMRRRMTDDRTEPLGDCAEAPVCDAA